MFAVRRRLTLPTRLAARQLHATTSEWCPRGVSRGPTGSRHADAEEYSIDDMPEFEDDDASSAAHIIIHQQRQILNYMRLIESEGPRLKALRIPFVPPPDSLPLIVRTISYAGEEHPAVKKQVIVVAVSQLPLSTPEAIHKAKLLAGTRWSSKPPRDSGVGETEDGRIGKHGYIKISCEDFPEPAMNLKWGSDVLDDLLKEANDTKDSFADIPHDQRHLDAKARKHRKGEHVRGRNGLRPTIKDFPQEWLPARPDQPCRIATQ